MRTICRFGVVVVACPSIAAATPCPSDLGPPAVYLLTFSPGTEVHSAFGHTALLLWEPLQRDRSRVYDFGHFDDSDPVALVWGIATNDQQYSVGEQSMGQMLHSYAPVGRGIIAQQLALSPGQTRTLADSLEDTLRSEPSFPYNWYRPNCTTRVGDLLDQILDGALAPQHQGPSGTSRARQVLRHSASLPWLWFGLHWGSGHEADREITDWESAFLPVTLKERIAASQLDGAPLVTDECQLLPDSSPPVPDEAPNRDGILGAIGLGAGAAVLGAGRAGRRVGLLATGLLGLAVGLFGAAALLVGALGAFAPSWGAHNLAFASPLHLGLAVAAILAWRRPTSRLPLWIAAGVLAVAALGIGLAVTRGFADRNLGIALLMVPPQLAAAWALKRAAVRR